MFKLKLYQGALLSTSNYNKIFYDWFCKLKDKYGVIWMDLFLFTLDGFQKQAQMFSSVQYIPIQRNEHAFN